MALICPISRDAIPGRFIARLGYNTFDIRSLVLHLESEKARDRPCTDPTTRRVLVESECERLYVIRDLSRMSNREVFESLIGTLYSRPLFGDIVKCHIKDSRLERGISKADVKRLVHGFSEVIDGISFDEDIIDLTVEEGASRYSPIEI